MNDKNAPSEVLWIGFPAQLKVDEFILRKAFAPFGEIDKITAFPGRIYASVRFRNVMAACRAKETFQGKSFGNPRVHICFAKSDSGVSSRERNSLNAPSSPHFRGYAHPGSSEKFLHDREFGSLSGHLMYEQQNSLSRDISHFREFSPEGFRRQGPIDDYPFDLPKDPLLFHDAKKLKTSTFPTENELPVYPLGHSGQANRVPSRAFPDFQPDSYEKNFDSEPFDYRQILNRQMKSVQPYGERSDCRSASYDSLHAGSESRLPSRKEEWQWEGTIAKGGAPVCRARCFPVGKELDMKLPEHLDCTGRTGLDMLAKHYYQGVGSWVAFFVPASDPDMVLSMNL